MYQCTSSGNQRSNSMAGITPQKEVSVGCSGHTRGVSNTQLVPCEGRMCCPWRMIRSVHLKQFVRSCGWWQVAMKYFLSHHSMISYFFPVNCNASSLYIHLFLCLNFLLIIGWYIFIYANKLLC